MPFWHGDEPSTTMFGCDVRCRSKGGPCLPRSVRDVFWARDGWVRGCLGFRGSLVFRRGDDLRCMRWSLRALVPLSQQFEGEDARVVTVVPGELEPPGAVQFSVLDSKRYRACRTGPAVLAPLTDVAARRTWASLAQTHQVELSDVAVVVRHGHPDVLGDVDGLGLMTFVHVAALQVRRGRSDDHCDDGVPVEAG